MKLLLSLLLISLMAISSVSAVSTLPGCTTDNGAAGSDADPLLCSTCSNSVVLPGGLAGTCIPNCAKASSDGKTCVTCGQNYARSVTGKSCQLIINNCDYSVSTASPPVYVSGYDDGGKCFRCASSYSVSFTGYTCAKTITGCNVYDDFGNCAQVSYCSAYAINSGVVQCSSCINSTYALSVSKYCVPAITNAQSLDNTGKIISCSGGNKLSATNLTCQANPDASCNAADDENLCAVCADPTKVRQAVRKADCLNTPSCTLAAGATCYTKIDNCTVYKAADGACLGCIPGYTPYPVGSAGNLCYKTVPYCTQYASATGLCSQCAGGALTLSVNGTACVAPVANCPAGNVNDQGKCITCNNGFAFSKNGLCVPQIPYCVAHDDIINLCIQCDSTTTLSSDRKICLRNFNNVANCAKYDANGICTACNVGKYLTKGGIGGVPSCVSPNNFTNPAACVEFDENGRCKLCFTDAGSNIWVFSVTKNSCVKPVTNCKEYNDLGTCNACNPGLVLFKNTCQTKVAGCQTYAVGGETGFSAGDCMGCQPGFFYQTGDKLCYPQIDGCTTYITQGCTACDTTAGLVYVVITGSSPANGKCVKKIPGCATYSYITGRCLTCTDSANQITGNLGVNCFKKIADCAQYAEPANDPLNPVCLDCGAKVPTQTGKACATAISQCLVYNDASPLSCSICAAGYLPSAATSAANAGLTCVTVATTSVDPTSGSIAAPSLDLNGPGQVIYNITNTLYCLTHYIVKDGSNNFDLSLSPTPPTGVDPYKNSWVNLFPCDTIPVERTLWKWVKYSGSATPSATATDYRVTGASTLELGLQVYFDPDYKPAGVKKTTGGTVYATDLPKLYKSSTTSLFPWEVSYDTFTTFTVAIVSTLPYAQDSFYKGFSLVPKNTYAWTPDDSTPTLGAATLWGTTNYVTYVSTPVGLAGTTPLEKFYLALSTSAPTNNWAFRSVQLSGAAIAALSDRGKFGSQITQTVSINDDVLTIDWVPLGGGVTNMKGIFPVLSKKVAGSTTIDSICNSRYPEFSRIPFLFSYDGTGTVVTGTGLPDPTKLLKVSVRIPVFRLVDCGFTAILSTTGASAGSTVLSGRIGYFSYDNLDGVFQDFTVTLGTQYALRNLQLDNMNSYNWYRLSSTDVAKTMNINSVVRFFQDPQLTQELQGVGTPDSRGLLVNSSLIYCKLDLVSSVVDPIGQTNGDPDLLVYQPLQDVYYVLSVKTYLHKKYDNTPNYWKTEVPSSNLVKGLNNTANWAIDLRRITSGNYIFSVEFFFSQWKVPGAKRILQSVESEVVEEEVSEEEIPFEMQMKSTTKDIILNINGLENLKVGLFALAIALFAIFGF